MTVKYGNSKKHSPRNFLNPSHTENSLSAGGERMQEREVSLDSKFDYTAEAERLRVWAKRATQVCSAWKLNQLAERCATFMDLEASEQGDWSGEHLQAFRSEQAAERQHEGIAAAAR